MNLRNQKGINMITLGIAVIILIVITSVLVYNSKDGVKVKTLNNLYNDIEALNNKVSAYYIKHGDIPKAAKYENLSFLSSADNNQKNPNNGDDFYVINLKALEGVSLNYGRDFDSISDSDTTVVALEDIYIINEVSHQIYYPRGIEVQGTTYYTQPDTWTNVELSIIPIYTAEQLSWVGDGQSHTVKGINYTFSLNGIYILKNDIDLSSVCHRVDGTVTNDISWTPIGQSGRFTGTFLGNGHEIQNIYMNYTAGPVGLFRTVGSNAIIKDLSVSGTAILSSDTSSTAYIGGIVGVAHSTFTITNCNNKVTTKIENSSHGAGGLIGGTATDAVISMNRCTNHGSISSSENAGGLIGYKATGGSVTITNSYNEGTINALNAAGGILGYINKNTAITITDCYNSGEVTNTGTKGTGGIVGFEDTGGTLAITRCNNTKNITGSANVGGINGYNSAGCTIENSSNNADIETTTDSGTSSVTGGIVGRNGGIIKKSYNDGNIKSKKNCTGGIAGSNPGVIEYSFNNGTINTTGSSGTGGITGYQSFSTARTSNCYNLKTINGKGDIAGIVGNNQIGTVENCYNIGIINGTAQVGSIVGRNQASGQITKSYYLDSLTTSLYGLNSGNVDTLSRAASQSDMTSTDKTKFVDLLNAGQTDEPWQLDTRINQGYPILKWQTE